MRSNSSAGGARRLHGKAFAQQASAAASDAAGAGPLARIIAASKSSGTLNLSNRQLGEVPPGVFELSPDSGSIKWWEVCELTKLDLSHNELQELPQQLTTLEALVTLLASNNALQQLPSTGMGYLAALRLLDLSHNPGLGPTLPEDLARLPALASLVVNNCGLARLPDALGGPQQPKLASLAAAGNSLAALPAGLAAAGALAVLRLGGNALTALPGGMVAGWRALKELDVSGNQLKVLPEELGCLPLLSDLDARGNQLGALPAGLGHLAQLAELKLGFNQLQTLPDSLGQLGQLRALDLRNNLVQTLPEALCGLQLVLLDLTNNCLRALPPALGRMTSLRSLPLDGNPLRLIRREVWAGPVSGLLQHLRDQMPDDGSGGDGAGPFGEQQQQQQQQQQQPPHHHHQQQQLKGVDQLLGGRGGGGGGGGRASSSGGGGGGGEGALSLRGTGLTRVPDDMWETAPGLTGLDLSDNPLGGDASLAPGLATLRSARTLALTRCGLAAWPLPAMEAGGGCLLPALTALEAAGNPLGGGALPPGALAACPRLRCLDLSGVRGLRLPDGLFSATPQLESLRLARSGLGELPAAVLDCRALRRLEVPGNGLVSLPAAITRLDSLEELDVRDNSLSGLPPAMGFMGPHLRLLLLEGNAIRTIRRPVLEGGTAAVLAWLRDRMPLPQPAA